MHSLTLIFILICSGLLFGCTGWITARESTPCPQPWGVTFGESDDLKDHREIDVQFQSGCEDLAGTLFVPTGKDLLATMVFVHGAGSSPRLHYTDQFLAPLVNSGIIVFSYDKRGVAASEGQCCPGDRAEFDIPAGDVLTAIDAVRQHEEVQQTPIGLIGVSQAGWIIPMVAAESTDVSFAVLLSGPAVSVGKANYFDDLTDEGVPVEQALLRLSEEKEDVFDPLPFLQRLEVPTLWLYGQLDKDQPTAMSVEVLERLVESQEKDFTIEVFSGAGHDLTHEMDLIPTIIDWIAAIIDQL